MPLSRYMFLHACTLSCFLLLFFFSEGSGSRVVGMYEAHRRLPHSWWWVKSDGCDLTAGLREPTDHKWSGDVDLGDGSLATLYREYTDRRKFIEGFGIGNSGAVDSEL